eukprot:5026318-Ditylum_brightwellii.AAC.2
MENANIRPAMKGALQVVSKWKEHSDAHFRLHHLSGTGMGVVPEKLDGGAMPGEGARQYPIV